MSQSAAATPSITGLPFHELYVSWRFVHIDLSSAFVPALFFTVAALRASPAVTLTEIGAAVGGAVLYFWLYIYTFCLSNQIAGEEEDRLNKPHRPIPQRLVSRRGALIRWLLASVAFSLVGAWFGVLEWSLLWQAVSFVHNFLGLARFWYLKCALMWLGTVAQLAAAWQMVTPITPTAWTWIIVIACFVFLTASIQDLRDMAGDRAIGRRTLPLVVGERRARFVLLPIFLALPVAIYLLLFAPFGGALAVVCGVAVAVMGILVATRMLVFRSPEEDHRSYLLYTCWYCSLLVSAAVLF